MTSRKNQRKKIAVCYMIVLFIGSILIYGSILNIKAQTNTVHATQVSSIVFETETYTEQQLNYPNQRGITVCSEDTLDWGVDRIDAEHVFGGYEDATGIGGDYTGEGITVAVIDSGIDKQSGNLHHDFTNKISGEWDFYYSDSSADDGYGHGTHCAGIIGARDDDDGVIGVAPECDFLIARIFNGNGVCCSLAGIVNAINWAVNNGADVISMSWGGYIHYDEIEEALEDAYAAGVVLVAAAGNDDTGISYPAVYPEVISVGAISSDDTRAGNPDWGWPSGKASNYGAALDLVAPGTEIWSSYLDDDIERMSGTSMAAPHVAGLCALILEAQPLLSPTQVKDVLKITTTDLGATGKDIYYGWGLVNADLAVDAAELYFTDTDGDYMPDGWEVNQNFNPLNSADGTADADGDGLRNFVEYNEGTDPHDEDTDEDGLSDKIEVDWHTNPLVDDVDADIDGDGLTNYEEIMGVYDYNGDGDYDDPGEYHGYHTEPTQFDTDEDGYGDGYEIDPNLPYDPSDPTDPNSIPSVGGGLW